MSEAIFLSAGVPDGKRAPKYAETSDPVAISSAISALLYVTLGRRQIVFGGQPGITPMVWSVAEDLGVDYAAWVKLYQSMEFEDVFPEETAKFGNVVFTEKGADLTDSLKIMRDRMFSDASYSAAVFIGGMTGIVEEFQLLSELQPQTSIVPVYSTGGAVLDLAELGAPDDTVLREDLDYIRLLADRLGIGAREPRYQTPADQPRDPAARVWKHPKD